MALNEDTLVQQTTADYLRDALGWRSEYAYNTEVLGPEGSFGRRSEQEVVLTRILGEKLIALRAVELFVEAHGVRLADGSQRLAGVDETLIERGGGHADNIPKRQPARKSRARSRRCARAAHAVSGWHTRRLGEGRGK